jgi:tetratricopeptide (TPR) repeat protein
MTTINQKPQEPAAPVPVQYPELDPDFRQRINTIYQEWLENKRDLGDAKQAFADLLKEAETENNAIHQGGVHNIMGVVNGYRGNYDESIQYFEKARALYEQVGALPRIATCDLNLGETYRLRGNFTRARSYFHKAYEAGKTLKRVNTQVIALTNEAQMWLSLNSVEKARATLEEALSLADTPWGEPEIDADRIARYGNICEIHHAMVEVNLAEGNPFGAWQHATKTLEYAEKTAQPDRLGYANRALGNVLTALDEPLDDEYSPDPDVYYTKALENFRRVKVDAEVGKTLFAQAKSFVKRGKRNSAGRLFQQAMVIFTKLGMTDDAAKAAEEQLRVI